MWLREFRRWYCWFEGRVRVRRGTDVLEEGGSGVERR